VEVGLELGSCILRHADAAGLVQSALLYFERQRYQLAAWCVMPNHVHVAYTTLGQHSPQDIHHSWKSYTSHEINKLLDRRGTLWERESFDHLIRSPEHYEAFVAYIENNPVEAGLCATPEEWPFSSASYFSR
jgi:REP element-mobilizing transposase RayT